MDADETQCSVCGEFLTFERRRFDSPPRPDGDDPAAPGPSPAPAPRLEITPGMMKLGAVWMVCCVVFAIICIAFAFHEYSTEAMWASFIAAGLAGLPLLYIILGRTAETAYWFRKELTMLCGIAGALFGVYLLAKAILKANIRVETAGMQELATDQNFTKTLMTMIICLTVIAALLPMAKMLLKSSTSKGFVNRYEIDSRQDMHTRTSENATAVELRRLELAHEAELKRLDLEQQRIQLEAERLNLLAHESRLMITEESGEGSPGPKGGPDAPAEPSPYAPPSPPPGK